MTSLEALEAISPFTRFVTSAGPAPKRSSTFSKFVTKAIKPGSISASNESRDHRTASEPKQAKVVAVKTVPTRTSDAASAPQLRLEVPLNPTAPIDPRVLTVQQAAPVQDDRILGLKPMHLALIGGGVAVLGLGGLLIWRSR